MPEPGNPQALNRYAYVLNNPIRYTDPTGHWVETVWDIANIGWDIYEVYRDPGNVWNWVALAADVGAAVLPVVPAGAGLVVRGGRVAKAAVEAASHLDEAVDAARVVAEAASHADEAADLMRVAERLTKVGRDAPEALDIIKQIAAQSTRGNLVEGGIVSLGHFRAVGDAPGYIDWAKKAGAVYFEMDEAIYRTLASDPDLVWAVNRQFLDNAIEAGTRFHLQVPPSMVRPGSYFEREIRYLLERGYRLVQEGSEWWLVHP